MFTVNAYAATSATEPLTRTTIERREVGPHDVLIEIKYVGICHSDIHHVRGDWGPVRYPVAPGHEIAGVVTQVGSGVAKHAVGDRVGVGCMVNSCRTCDSCLNGTASTAPRSPTAPWAGTALPPRAGTAPTSSSTRTSSSATREMLDFCGEHGIGAEIEVVPVEKTNEAYERVLSSDVRYRFVIDMATLA
ncbi:alcohol dehydrogenase catalytic domain-containing protein [Streptomyces sp. NPDC024017]|uniref:alcohol dehydrogenase catalytic domain-containing protein n=1 Tax=Streptomyces sp. NPDC024017 TaxID=3154326 RepID=UPI0033D06402